MNDPAVILVVEDNVDLAEMLRTYFIGEGYEVITATRGEQALKKISTLLPDLITLDIHLPDIDGYDVYQRIREIPRAQLVPVIFLTERKNRNEKLSGLDLGAVDYITKPFDIEELGIRVRNAIGTYKKRSSVHSVTSLPAGREVKYQLEQMLTRPEWAVVLVSLEGMNEFRDMYGFVSADDVARATSLMLKNVLTAGNKEATFLGQVGPSKFVMITGVEASKQLAQECLTKLESAIPYFYPAHDLDPINPSSNNDLLAVDILLLSSLNDDIANYKELEDIILTTK